jgi:hypothetical protein
MNAHRHPGSEEIFERLIAGEAPAALGGCESCEAEALSLSRFLADLKRADTQSVATTEWDDLLMRRRIREAIAKEKPHGRSLFDRFFVLKPALVSALVASVVLVVWGSLSTVPQSTVSDQGTRVASMISGPAARIPSWTPLPEESEDEGLAVLAEWTPNEDEVAIARCHSACLSGLSDHEEENLLHSVSTAASRSPLTEASPL